MTKEEAIKIIQLAKDEIEWRYPLNYKVAFDMPIKAQKQMQEPLTDEAQRIFLTANYENILISICHRIKRKVKKALWG